MAKVNPIPEGYSTVVSYISVKGASDAIAYYKKAFSAEELVRMPMPDGKVGHAELKIGDSILMLADEMDHPDAIAKSPRTWSTAPGASPMSRSSVPIPIRMTTPARSRTTSGSLYRCPNITPY